MEMNIQVNLDLAKASKSIDQMGKELNEAFSQKAGAKISDEIADMYTEIEKFNNLIEKTPETFKDLKQTIQEIRDEIIKAQNEPIQDPEKIAKLTSRANELRDQIDDVNESLRLTATGSPFEAMSNQVGNIGQKLKNLDFSGANEQAEKLKNSLNNINPEGLKKELGNVTALFSNMGSIAGTAIGSLLKTLPTLIASFASFGASLLVNPIFLIGAVIAGLVAIIAKVVSKMEIFKVIGQAVGDAFAKIGEAINFLVSVMDSLTDSLGLTNKGAQDSARAHTEAMEKKADAYEKSSKRAITSLDNEIEIAKLNGKDTVKLELEKQAYIRKTAEIRLEALKAKYEENRITKELDTDEIKDLKEKINLQREAISASIQDEKVIKIQAENESKAKREEAQKENQTNYENNKKEKQEQARNYESDRLNAQRTAKDLELSLLDDGFEKEKAILTEQFKRKIEDVGKNTKLLQVERDRQTKLLEDQQGQGLTEIDQKEAQRKELIRQAEKTKEDQLKAEAKAARDAEKERELIAEIELIKINSAGKLDAEIQYLETKKTYELTSKEFTESEKLIIEAKYIQERDALILASEEKERAEKLATINKGTDIAKQGLNAVSAITDVVFANRSKGLKKGSEEQIKLAKKQFQANKLMQLGGAVIDGAKAITASLASAPVAVGVIPNPAGIASLAFVASSTIATLAKIGSTQFEGGGSGAVSVSAPTASEPTQPTAGASNSPNVTNLFGQNNNQNTTQQATNVVNNITNNGETVVKAYVVESDITNAQASAQLIEKNATL